ncbi:MAG: galactose mutarotase [Bacteroidales bacterium]|nr:galactose mutarotase [Bacteroidales bacterium]
MERFRLENNNGVEVEFLSLGGRIYSVKVPNNSGKLDVALGCGELPGDAFMGAFCGRFANRIKNGTFILDGEVVELPKNEYPNHVHGGNQGFNTKFWEVTSVSLEGYVSAFRLKLFSPDGEEGYPGNLETELIYALNDNNELLIDIKAKTDKPTIVNLTSHPYFNLNGVDSGLVLNHKLQIFADHYAPTDERGVPTGEIAEVEGTDLDFLEPHLLINIEKSNFPQIVMKGGLDNTWVIKGKDKSLVKACVLSEPKSGRAIELYTTQPALQVYTGNHFDGSQKEKCGIPLKKYSGVALEAQNIPDAPNKPHFPNAVLRENEIFHEQIVYRFIF